MGLIEQIVSGAVFKRERVTFSAFDDPPSVYMGASYILLNVSSSYPSRVRLYGNSSSIAIDALRPSSSFEYSASVVLNLDAELDSTTPYIEFVPPIIATTHLDQNKTWHYVQSPVNAQIAVEYYPIEFNTSSREFIPIPDYTGVSLGAYQTSSGNITTPKSFLLLSALSDNTDVRLRLYSRPISDVPNYELTRQFATSSATGSHLICDLLFDSASYLYRISPVLQAYNLEEYETGNNRVGYILENLSASPQTGVYAAVQVYSLED